MILCFRFNNGEKKQFSDILIIYHIQYRTVKVFVQIVPWIRIYSKIICCHLFIHNRRRYNVYTFNEIKLVVLFS